MYLVKTYSLTKTILQSKFPNSANKTEIPPFGLVLLTLTKKIKIIWNKIWRMLSRWVTRRNSISMVSIISEIKFMRISLGLLNKKSSKILTFNMNIWHMSSGKVIKSQLRSTKILEKLPGPIKMEKNLVNVTQRNFKTLNLNGCLLWSYGKQGMPLFG